jgi:excisionase family DNA binding protein
MAAMLENTSHSLNKHYIRSSPPINMSVVEASLYLGVSERKLRESIARREVKHVRFGSRIILRKLDLDSFLDGMVA